MPPQSLHQRALAVMPGGVSSPVRAFSAVGGQPLFIARAQGPYVFDADGNRYIDLVGSWGTAVVGHAHPAVVKAVQDAAAEGLSFGACCEPEVLLAERIAGALPAAEMVRFVNSGTEAAMSAARLARAATGRDTIIKFEGNYHGHADPFLIAAGSGAATFGTPTSPGVPPSHTVVVPYNDPQAAAAAMEQSPPAAVIVEPVAGNMGLVPPAPGFLESLRKLCDDHGALLIFDEVMTGFRVAWGGYQNTSGVRPDLTCLGKVIGGGLPVAAYAGPKHLMEQLSPAGRVYQAGTLSGNPLGMAAGLATLDVCAQDGFYDRLSATSRALADGFKSAAAGIPVQTDAVGGMAGLFFSPEPVTDFAGAKAADHGAFARFFRAMLARGVWLPPSGYEAMFVSAAHAPEHIDAILDAARQAFRETA